MADLFQFEGRHIDVHQCLHCARNPFSRQWLSAFSPLSLVRTGAECVAAIAPVRLIGA